MEERLRKLAIKVLLVLGTTLSIMGFNYTHSYLFVPLPFIIGLFLAALVISAPTATREEIEARKKRRRNGFIQLVISCVMLSVFISIASVRHWGKTAVVGLTIMEGTLVLLAALALWAYHRTHLKLDQKEEELEE
ncbi:MAG: hypothetical protein ACYC99_10020 [Candidatus Geothermincolia bacterium]